MENVRFLKEVVLFHSGIPVGRDFLARDITRYPATGTTIKIVTYVPIVPIIKRVRVRQMISPRLSVLTQLQQAIMYKYRSRRVLRCFVPFIALDLLPGVTWSTEVRCAVADRRCASKGTRWWIRCRASQSPSHSYHTWCSSVGCWVSVRKLLLMRDHAIISSTIYAISRTRYRTPFFALG